MQFSTLKLFNLILQSQVITHELKTADYYLIRLKNLAILYGPKAIMGAVILVIGLWLIRKLSHSMTRLLMARNVDKSLLPFARSVLSIFLKATLILSILSFIGFNTTSFVTALGAAGLAVGLALQGSLSNFAGGVLILVFKPFRVGDVIEAQGHRGTVKEVQILYTTIITPDNKKIVIPNGSLSNKDIINFTAEDNRRIDLKIPVAHGTDVAKAREILRNISESVPLIISEPAPIIGLHEITATGMNLDFFFWVKRINLTEVHYLVNENIIVEFAKAGIRFADDTKEIHVHTHPEKED